MFLLCSLDCNSPHFRERLLRHSLPISLLILRKKTGCFTVYMFFKVFSACTYTYVSIILKEVALPQERQESKSWILDSALWIPDSRYLVPDFLSVKLEFRIPVVSGVSGFLELELEIPTPRFWIPQK